MRRIVTFTAALAISTMAGGTISPAYAGERADELMWQCSGQMPEDMPRLGLLTCVRYIQGFLDMHATMVHFERTPMFCPPAKGVSGDQARLIYLKWAEDNPADLHRTARVGVTLALALAFPCDG